ncbi:MAG: sigma-70 family RNA polymerase sigma factor [Rhizobacter sp.]|nr:sigma-70 family RNA polymerase sigma factor [Chlorobiales bacterium]
MKSESSPASSPDPLPDAASVSQPVSLQVEQTIDHLFRHEAGKMVSVLTRIFGTENVELAEDVVQDALLSALQQWKMRGLPPNPSAWLMTVAKSKAIDAVRREKHKRKFAEENAVLLASEYTILPTFERLTNEEEIKDDVLRMMFACCHPSIGEESQLVLILKLLCGFSTAEIAKAFLSNDETITKRLYRAKAQFRENSIRYQLPEPEDLQPRLAGVLKAIYLLLNEGYNSATHTDLIRKDLIEESFRLCFMLTENTSTAEPETFALLALICFHAARVSGRLDAEGNLLLLEAQDRSRWNRSLIEKGRKFLSQSAQGERFTAYHAEAAIAFEHCLAPDYRQTNWQKILALYDLLLQHAPTPVVELNRAIAVGELYGAPAGLKAVEAISEKAVMNDYYLYHATQGEFYFRMGDAAKAKGFFESAAALTQSHAEKKLLAGKIELCQ